MTTMEHRVVGGSGFRVPVLSLGTAAFGGCGDVFSKCGTIDVAEPARVGECCLDPGDQL